MLFMPEYQAAVEVFYEEGKMKEFLKKLLVLFLLDDYVLPGLVSIPMTLGVSGLLRLLDTLTFFL